MAAAEMAVKAAAAAVPEMEERPVAATRESIRLLLPYLRPYRRELGLLLLGVGVETAFNAWVPLSFSYLIDDALVPRNEGVLIAVLVGLGASVVVTAAIGVARDRLYART